MRSKMKKREKIYHVVDRCFLFQTTISFPILSFSASAVDPKGRSFITNCLLKDLTHPSINPCKRIMHHRKTVGICKVFYGVITGIRKVKFPKLGKIEEFKKKHSQKSITKEILSY